MNLRIETELEEDGRWIAEVPQLPGVLAYGRQRRKRPPRPRCGPARAGRKPRAGESKPVEIRISLTPA